MLDMFVGFFLGLLIGCGLTWNYMNTKLWGVTNRLQDLSEIIAKSLLDEQEDKTNDTD